MQLVLFSRRKIGLHFSLSFIMTSRMKYPFICRSCNMLHLQPCWVCKSLLAWCYCYFSSSSLMVYVYFILVIIIMHFFVEWNMVVNWTYSIFVLLTSDTLRKLESLKQLTFLKQLEVKPPKVLLLKIGTMFVHCQAYNLNFVLFFSHVWSQLLFYVANDLE